MYVHVYHLTYATSWGNVGASMNIYYIHLANKHDFMNIFRIKNDSFFFIAIYVTHAKFQITTTTIE